MMPLLLLCFQAIGIAVCLASASLATLWISNAVLKHWLQARSTCRIFLRFAWIVEERRRKAPPPEPGPMVDGPKNDDEWYYAHHRDDEHWTYACANTREQAIAEALSHAQPGETMYVVLGKRPTGDDFADGISAEWILDHLIDHASDNGLLGDSDESLTWTSKRDFETELQDLIARHLTRPRWWCCDGSQAEAVTKPETPDPPAGAELDSDSPDTATPDEQSRSPGDLKPAGGKGSEP